MPPSPVQMDDLVEEVLLRLPPDEPAWLARASAACKSWRHILAARRFRLRYREFHGTPPLLGFFKVDNFEVGRSFVSTSALFPAAQVDNMSYMFTTDCRHGRALLVTIPGQLNGEFAVLDPLTGRQSCVPWPHRQRPWFSASVLCAAQGCDHRECEGDHFLVALVSTHWSERVTSGWLYSSENRVWSALTSVHHPNIKCDSHSNAPSVLVGDSLYFNVGGTGIIECRLGTLRLSMFEKPIDGQGTVMAAEDGGLGFAAVVNVTNLTIWSMETGPEGAMGWAKLRVIDLKTLLPDGALSIPEHEVSRFPGALGSAFAAEGTQMIFVRTCVGSYVIDLKSGKARRVSCDGNRIFPYMRFYIPAMEAACTGQGQ